MAIWSQFRSILFGGAIGAAARTAIEPQIEPARQRAWSRNKNRVLDLEVLGVLVAQGLAEAGEAEEEAGRTGYDPNRLEAMIALAQKAPPVAEALTLRRRKRISDDDLEHAFAKAAIEPRWWPELKRLVDERLSPQVVALAIVRGLIPDPGILPVGPPSEVGRVRKFPVFDIDALDEAASEGFNRDRLSVLAGIAGRPMSPEAAAQAVFRDIIEKVDYQRAIAEGDVRNEWAEAIFETARAVLSPADGAGLHLRGWISKEQMYAIGALHGASRETMDGLYLNRGRPAAPGQMANAIVRGIDGPEGRPMDKAQFLKGIAQSDIRPEWGPMLFESFYLYPSLFQLNRLVTGGTVSPEVGALWAKKARYAPEVIVELRKFWAQASGGGAAKWVSRAQSRLYTTAHDEYLDGEIPDTAAVSVLEQIGASTEEAGQVVDLWTLERGIYSRDLTQAQLLKLYKKGIRSEAEAREWLLAHGTEEEDADDLLRAV